MRADPPFFLRHFRMAASTPETMRRLRRDTLGWKIRTLRCVKRPPTRAASFFIAAFLLARGGRDTMARIPSARLPSVSFHLRVYLPASANHISVGDACRITRFPVSQAPFGAPSRFRPPAGIGALFFFCGSLDLVLCEFGTCYVLGCICLCNRGVAPRRQTL